MARNYYANSFQVAAVAAATDLAVIGGDANRTVQVRSLTYSAQATAAAIGTFYLVKRSSKNTGGTAVSMVKVPADSRDIPAAAVVQSYTANPTTGTDIGFINIRKVNLSAVGSSVPSNITLDFSLAPIVLKDDTEQLALNFAGAAVPAGMVVNTAFEWTEE